MAAKPSHLRAVRPDEPPVAPVKPKTIVEAAESDDSLSLLLALRSRLAQAVQSPETLARDLASLSRRLIEVDRDIKARRAQEQQEAESDDVADGEFDAEAI